MYIPAYFRFMEPLTRGDYPLSMKSLVGKRLPKFSKEQSEMLKRSFDFIGLNYYTTNYVFNSPPTSNDAELSYSTDPRTSTTGNEL